MIFLEINSIFHVQRSNYYLYLFIYAHNLMAIVLRVKYAEEDSDDLLTILRYFLFQHHFTSLIDVFFQLNLAIYFFLHFFRKILFVFQTDFLNYLSPR